MPVYTDHSFPQTLNTYRTAVSPTLDYCAMKISMLDEVKLSLDESRPQARVQIFDYKWYEISGSESFIKAGIRDKNFT